jgi:wyosine [tRNA(Phe)-imidazoG37] synthetase (radical SAM superfamily)
MSTYTYGPVPSRRLGRSLGVDLVPLKTCNLNCVYCQLGATPQTTMERRDYCPPQEVVADVRTRLAEIPPPDYVTLGGSGEPTLHRSFGEIADGVRAACDVPVALLTNGCLFSRPEVRSACRSVDLVLPSLDAGDEETFRRVNRPHPDLALEALVSGLAALRAEFAGQIWLEVFIVEGLNTSDEQLAATEACIDRIRPDRVQINTAVRPPAEAGVGAASEEMLERVRRSLGHDAEIIAPAPPLGDIPGAAARKEDVLALLRRRPCTPADVASGLGIHPPEVAKYLRALLDEGSIVRRQRLYDTYYEADGGDD